MSKHRLAELFFTFMKIGLFTFGGGYAMISMIEHTCTEQKKWLSHDELMDLTVIAESTPGPIAINCSTFIGYRQAGFWGAFFSTCGMVLPSFVIIFLISLCFDHFLDIPLIANAFHGIKIAVGLLIFYVGINLLARTPKRPLTYTILFATFFLMLAADLFSFHLSTTVLMLCCGLISVSLCLIQNKKTGKGGGKQ